MILKVVHTYISVDFLCHVAVEFKSRKKHIVLFLVYLHEINEKPKHTTTTELTTTTSPKNCDPIKKLAFAKTHKTGGKLEI